MEEGEGKNSGELLEREKNCMHAALSFSFKEKKKDEGRKKKEEVNT